MAYTIEWRKDGAVKRFTGTVAFNDVIKSEREIAGHSKYTSLWYIVSDFTNAKHPGLTESERDEVRSLRLGRFFTNPRIKYAFATGEIKVMVAIQQSVFDGHTLHATKVFPTFEEALAWAMAL